VTQEKARQEIGTLIQKYKGMSEKSKKEITEAGVVHQVLDAFLRALGWPVDDPERYKYELFVAGGRRRSGC
jgi:predicted type IV restriction endonuclease